MAELGTGNMTVKPHEPHEMAEQDRDKFVQMLEAEKAQAEKALACVMEERERAEERFSRRERAARQVFEMCQGALMQLEADKPQQAVPYT